MSIALLVAWLGVPPATGAQTGTGPPGADGRQNPVVASGPSGGEREVDYFRQVLGAFREAVARATLEIHPGAVLFTRGMSSATLQLTNPWDTTITVELMVRRTVVRTTSVGILVRDSAVPAATPYDLTGWVHGLPERITIAAGQTVKLSLTVAVPAQLAAGEYWSSIVAIARDVRLPLTILNNEGRRVTEHSRQPVNVMTVVPLLYREGTVATAVAIEPVRAGFMSDSLLRVCVPIRLTGPGTWPGPGLAHAEAAVRVTARRVGDRDTTAPDTTVATLLLGVYGHVAPCLELEARGLQPGAYEVSVDVTDNRPDLSAEAKLPFPAQHYLTRVVLAPAVREAADLARARDTVPDMSDSVLTFVELKGADGSLSAQLAAHVVKAIARGRTPLLVIGATWCGPCHLLNRMLRRPVMREAVRGLYIIHVKSDMWGGQVDVPLDLSALPVLAALDRRGRLTATREIGVPTDADETALRPDEGIDAMWVRLYRVSLTAFFARVRAEFTK